MYYKKYEGERIYLSPLSVDDYQIYTKWFNTESLSKGLGSFSRMVTDLNEKEWIEQTLKSGSNEFAIIRKEDNVLIGTYGVQLKDSIARRYHIGGYIGEVDERGKGYGTEALKLVTKYAFEILNAETIFSGIFEFNVASLKSAIKAGYSVAGKYRKAYYYNGEFHDKNMIEITKEDYLKTKKNS